VLGLIYLPLAWPFARLLSDPAAANPLLEPGRALALLGNSLTLVLGTLLGCGPAGCLLAILLQRTDLPARYGLRVLLFLTLFIPLPLVTSGWQTILGSGGWWPMGFWNRAGAWTPWGQGMGSAVWIHSVAGLPWVVLLVGQGLTWVEREVEEAGLLEMPPWRVFLRISLPRAGAGIVAALLWIGVQTGGEITVTDVMQVRTAAEEVYTQLVTPEQGGVGDPVTRALVVSLPGVVLAAILVAWLARRWESTLPPAEDLPPPRVFGLGVWRWPAFLFASGLCLGLAAVPLSGLIWRAGLSGRPAAWSLPALTSQLRLILRVEAWDLAGNLLLAGCSGISAGLLALLICWVCLDAPRWRTGILMLLAVGCVLPGPLVGLGLKDASRFLLDLTGWPTLPARWLWYGPSYLPLYQVHLFRYLPCAVALVWPVLRLVPREWRDLARVNGATPWQELRYLLAPLAWPVAGRAALAVAVLSLGELSAGKLVSTPQAQGYAELIFAQMHYGITPGLAAQCLLLLTALLPVAGLLICLATRSEER
jgi:iron(III) transport system permease protein